MRILSLALLLAVGCSEGPPVAAPAFDFAAYGDCRHNEAVHREIAGRLVRSNPRFVLVTGDLVDRPDIEKEWDSFRDIAKELRAKSEYLCAVGDHDWEKSDTFVKEFRLEKLYFDRRIGDVHVFVLDSRSRFKDAEQVKWIEETAAASKAKHRIAVFHHPPFMIHPRRAAEAEEIRPRIHPLLVRLKFCAAICGHQHGFYSTLRDGVRYVVTAGGGAPLADVDPSLGQKGDLWRRFFHYCGFTAVGTTLEARVYGKDGAEAGDLRFTLCEHP